jgi:mRNA interferase RelE/StbE
MYKLVYSKEAVRQITKLSERIKKQIRTAIEKISGTPEIGKELLNELHGLRSYRSGNYRIIYEIDKKCITIWVLAIGHRKDVYRKLRRRL